MINRITIALTVIFLATFLSTTSHAQGCTRLKPTIMVSPSSISGPSDITYFLTLTVRNEDTQACGFTSFSIETSLPTGWTSFIRVTPKSIFPQQSEIVTIDITVPKDAVRQQHQAIIVVKSPNHDTPALRSSVTSLITIRDEPKTCTISVDDIIFRKGNTDVEKSIFCLKETGDVDAKISLRGNTEGQVSVDLLIDGKLVGSSLVSIKPDNFASLTFNNSINTQAFGKSTPNVKIVAKTACASSEATREKRFEIDICDPSCLFTTSIAAPLEKGIDRDLITSVYTRNIGNKENLIAIESAVCREATCIPMVCEISSVKLQPEESKSYSCKYKVRDTGTHAIETKIFACGKEETQAKSFFGLTTTPITPGVLAPGECKVEPLPEFRCNGSIRQRLSRNSDCSTTWIYSQYCPNGCTGGLCISSGEDVRGFEPIVTLDKGFESGIGSDALLSFEIENSITSPAKFDIKVSGAAAKWISVPSSIIVGEKSREQVSFSASVPSDVQPGDYDFTINVSTGARSVSKSSSLKVVEGTAQAIPTEMVVVLVIVVIMVFILLRFLGARPSRKEAF